MGGFERKKL